VCRALDANQHVLCGNIYMHGMGLRALNICVLADGKYQRREKAPCRSLRELREGKSISTQI